MAWTPQAPVDIGELSFDEADYTFDSLGEGLSYQSSAFQQESALAGNWKSGVILAEDTYETVGELTYRDAKGSLYDGFPNWTHEAEL